MEAGGTQAYAASIAIWQKLGLLEFKQKILYRMNWLFDHLGATEKIITIKKVWQLESCFWPIDESKSNKHATLFSCRISTFFPSSMPKVIKEWHYIWYSFQVKYRKGHCWLMIEIKRFVRLCYLKVRIMYAIMCELAIHSILYLWHNMCPSNIISLFNNVVYSK